MPLSAGIRQGHYGIVSALGAGGRGEVYRARDTRLDRIVAIKILPGHVRDVLLLFASSAGGECAAGCQRSAAVAPRCSPDLLVATNGFLGFVLGNGDRTFRSGAMIWVGRFADVSVSDFDGDGRQGAPFLVQNIRHEPHGEEKQRHNGKACFEQQKAQLRRIR